jgi:hypothetical protein
MKIDNDYYIQEGFEILAGPYNENSPREKTFLQSVINDLKAGNIEYKLEPAYGEKGAFRGTNVLRKGMILPKKK